MTSDVFFPIGIMAGLMLGIWALSRKAAQTRHYDEMQLKIRANGYKLGFFTVLALLALLMVLSETGLSSVVSPSLALFAVLMAGVITFAVYCILHEAFLSVGNQGKSYLAVFTIVIACNAAVAVVRLLNGEIMENGLVTLDFGAPALVCVGFLAALIALLIKMARVRKEAAE